MTLIPVYPAGVTTPGQPDSIDGSAVPVIPVSVERFRSTDHIETGQHGTIGTVAARIVGGNINRRVITLRNEGTVDVYLGNEGVVVSSGFRIGVGQSLTLETGGDVYGITPSGTGVIHWLAEIEAPL